MTSDPIFALRPFLAAAQQFVLWLADLIAPTYLFNRHPSATRHDAARVWLLA
jgi:hypothetical protein